MIDLASTTPLVGGALSVNATRCYCKTLTRAQQYEIDCGGWHGSTWHACVAAVGPRAKAGKHEGPLAWFGPHTSNCWQYPMQFLIEAMGLQYRPKPLAEVRALSIYPCWCADRTIQTCQKRGLFRSTGRLRECAYPTIGNVSSALHISPIHEPLSIVSCMKDTAYAYLKWLQRTANGLPSCLR